MMPTLDVPQPSPLIDDPQIVESSDDYVYVRFPDGIRAVHRSEINPPTSIQETPALDAVPIPEVHFYVHLANGTVKRVKEENLPIGGSTNAPLGHWQEGNKLFQVIGVYPVETIIE